MIIKKHKHSLRTAKAKEIWNMVAEDYKNGISVDEIRTKYPNQYTKKPRTREWVYFVLHRLEGLGEIKFID